MILTIIGVLLIIAFLCYIYGVFKPVKLHTGDLLNPQILYYSFKGPMKLISNEFDKIDQKSKHHFKISNGFGIYYSQPEQPEWKCVLGILVSQGEKHKVADFLQKNPQFKHKQLRNTRFVGTQFPYINFLSFFLIHTKIQKFINQINSNNYPLFKGSFEIYHFNFRFKKIQLINPINYQQQFDLYEDE